jgi:hypothetical protein
VENRSFKPPFRLVVGGIHYLDAEAQQETVEDRIGQVTQVIKEHIELVTPNTRIAVTVAHVNGLVQSNAPLESSEAYINAVLPMKPMTTMKVHLNSRMRTVSRPYLRGKVCQRRTRTMMKMKEVTII